MATVTSVLAGLAGILFGLLVYFKGKKENAEALLQNQDTKNKLNELDKDKSKNDGLLDAEEEKRKALEAEAERRKNENVTKDDLTDFFGKR